MARYWTTAAGDRIAYEKLEDSHLRNIITFIEKKAEEGFTVTMGGGGWDIEDMWYDETHYSGEKAKSYFDYKNICKEAVRRGIMTDREYILKI